MGSFLSSQSDQRRCLLLLCMMWRFVSSLHIQKIHFTPYLIVSLQLISSQKALRGDTCWSYQDLYEYCDPRSRGRGRSEVTIVFLVVLKKVPHWVLNIQTVTASEIGSSIKLHKIYKIVSICTKKVACLKLSCCGWRVDVTGSAMAAGPWATVIALCWVCTPTSEGIAVIQRQEGEETEIRHFFR